MQIKSDVNAPYISRIYLSSTREDLVYGNDIEKEGLLGTVERSLRDTYPRRRSTDRHIKYGNKCFGRIRPR